MRLSVKYFFIILVLVSAVCFTSCSNQYNDQGASDNTIISKIFSGLGNIFSDAKEYAADQIEKNTQHKDAGQTEKNTQDKNTSDMTGIPDVVSTITSDDGSRLVLVNKLHAVSSDYYPSDMVAVDGSLSTNQGLYFKKEAYDAYLAMLADAKKEGLNFLICSTYRSYDLQASLYNNSMAQYGAAYTNTRSAYPGRSEHHTGWAVDITSKSMGYGLSQNFVNYPEGLWINNHCSEYGFIIRYPKGKTYITGYDYEPWHLRYVGVDAASEITSRGITLEEYLGEA